MHTKGEPQAHGPCGGREWTAHGVCQCRRAQPARLLVHQWRRDHGGRRLRHSLQGHRCPRQPHQRGLPTPRPSYHYGPCRCTDHAPRCLPVENCKCERPSKGGARGPQRLHVLRRGGESVTRSPTAHCHAARTAHRRSQRPACHPLRQAADNSCQRHRVQRQRPESTASQRHSQRRLLCGATGSLR